MIRHKEEKYTRKQLAELQLERLKKLVKRVYDKVPFYKQAFDQAGVKPKHLTKLSDLAKFPFTSKADLRDNYPFGMFAVPMKQVVRVNWGHLTNFNLEECLVIWWRAFAPPG